MKVLAFAASNSRKSINKQLIRYAGKRLEALSQSIEVQIVDLNDFEMPIYSIDREQNEGVPKLAHAFKDQIGAVDAVLISFAEHNGNFTVAFKNIFDWMTRIDRNIFQGKPLVLLSTAPGPGGGANVLKIAVNAFPHFGGEVKASLSVPKFQDSFDTSTGKLKDQDLASKLDEALKDLIV